MSINRVILSGNLTRDPELRQTQSGTAVLSFGLAVNDRRKNPTTGEWEDVPNFFDCTVFGNRAQSLSGILAKGMKVAIEGRLHWSQWERDGQKRSKVDVNVDEVVLMQQRGNNQASAPQGYGQPATMPAQQQNGYQMAPQPVYQAQPQPTLYDDDIPF